MKKTLIAGIVVVVFVLMFTGCSTTRVIKQQEELTVNKEAVLVKKNDERINVKNVKIKEDSIFAAGYFDAHNLHFHFSEIKKIEVSQNSAVRLGLLGAVAGASWGYWGTPDEPGDPLAQPGYWAVILGGLGGGIGYFLGTHLERKETLLLEQNDMSRNSKGTSNN